MAHSDRLDAADMDVDRLRQLFTELDHELVRINANPVRVTAVGGAALAFRWAERGTVDVDLVSSPMPPQLTLAAEVIAERHDLDPAWLNTGAIGTPALEPEFEPLYRGECLEVVSPGPLYLLAMKVFAARARDLDDTVQLMQDLGISRAEELLELVDLAYYHSTVPPEIRSFAQEAAAAVAVRASASTASGSECGSSSRSADQSTGGSL